MGRHRQITITIDFSRVPDQLVEDVFELCRHYFGEDFEWNEKGALIRLKLPDTELRRRANWPHDEPFKVEGDVCAVCGYNYVHG
jgi:hypothetical protein